MTGPVDVRNARRVFTLLREYRWAWLRADVIAGVTVAAIAIPESLGYATIAGLPVQTGLYCALLPPVLFAIVASSRQLVVGADSATAALVAAGATAVAATGSAAYAGAVGVLGLLTAAMLLVMALARLGFLADLISRPVLAGFLSGVGVSLIIGKLPGVLGLDVSGTTWQKLVETVQSLGDVNATSAALGLGVVLVMVGTIRIPAQIPSALFAAVAFSVLGVIIGAADRGVAMVGALPPGLPEFAWPSVQPGEAARLTATAASIAVVVLAQSAAVSRSFGQKNRYSVNTNADLVALSAANAGSAVTGGFAINGSPPRTAAGDSSGSRSQMVNVVMALVIGGVLLFATGLFEYVPSPVLDAIVLGIGIHLIKVGELRRVGRTRPAELYIALLALVVVAFVGVEQGVLLAVIFSLIDRARRQYRPSEETLLRDDEVGDRARARLGGIPPERLDGVVAYRFGASLFFANATYFDEKVRALVDEAGGTVRLLVLDAGAMTEIDVTGAEVLAQLADDLGSRGIRVVLTDLSEPAAATLRRGGVAPAKVDVADHLEDAVAHRPV